MFFGVGASLAKHFSPDEMLVLPYPSSLSLAAARMGWALQDVQTVSVHGRPLNAVFRAHSAGCEASVLSNDGTTPARVATLLAAIGFGQSV